MPFEWTSLACLLLGLASARVSGVFLAFSDFLMRAFREADAPHGIDVMQRLNQTVMRSEFLATFMALAPLSLGAIVYAALRLDGAPARLIIGAGLTYFVAVFLVTIARNVPMNKRLDAAPFDSQAAADYWRIYAVSWTRWNSLRSIGALAAAGLYLFAAMLLK
ncbi:MAG: anthrone oxygenase family protein [Pseudomonadota bacterium]